MGRRRGRSDRRRSATVRVGGVVVAVWSSLAVTATPVTVTGTAAAAAQPLATMEVVPATGLVDGQVVDVEVRGVEGEVLVTQCDSVFVPPDPWGQNISLVHCRWRWATAVDGVARLPFDVDQDYETEYRGETYHTQCGGAGRDCVMVALDGQFRVQATAPIHFGPPRPEPAMTVTPSTGIRPGDQVKIRVVGLGTEPNLYLAQCDRETTARLADDPYLVFQACREVGFADGAKDPLVVQTTIVDAWLWPTQYLPLTMSSCGPEPGGCSIVAFAPERGGVALTAPIDVDPDTLAVLPLDQEAGVPVDATIHVPDHAGSTVRIAQCAAPVGPTVKTSRCAPSRPVAVDGAGAATAALPLVEAIAVGRSTVRCTHQPCVVAVFAASGPGGGATLGASPRLTVYPADGPPTMTVLPAGPHHDGQQIELRFHGSRNTVLRVAQCDASVVATGRFDGAHCSYPAETWAGRDAPTAGAIVLPERWLTTLVGTTVRCDAAPGDCVYAVTSDPGGFMWAPITFTPAPVATLRPDSGLVDGQNVTYTVTGLQPDTTYEVERCDGPVSRYLHCAWTGIAAVASGDGRLEVVVPALASFTTIEGVPVDCRRQCHLGIWGQPGTLVPYAMADTP